MILCRNLSLNFLFATLLSVFSLSNAAAQINSLSESVINIENSQDTSVEVRNRHVALAEPDTNFTWEKYAAFLTKISDTSKYIVLPLNEFRQTYSPNKVVIGLRHDVDNDLSVAFSFSEIEWKLGLRSTYFILHSAPYYLSGNESMTQHSPDIIPVLQTMQNERKLEIGWHNDLVTLQLFYGIDPVAFFHNELSWLRENGIDIYGTAAHGSNYCRAFHYLNYYFFNEFTFPVVPERENNVSVPVNGINIPIIKANLSDFDLKYEAYFLNYNKGFSDAEIIKGIRWDVGKLDLNQLHPGERAIILLHPVHWHKGSQSAEMKSFSVPGQVSSVIDSVNSEIFVEMPYNTNLKNIKANFILSSGAYAKVSGRLQVSESSENDFTFPVKYRVYAENRSVIKEWNVTIQNAQNHSCEFQSFVINGYTKSVKINYTDKTVLLKVSEVTDLTHLTPHFELSHGATAWIDGVQQLTDAGILNFSNTLEYKIIAENGNTSCIWYITVRKEQNQANFLSFSFPGMIGPARIDTLKNTIEADINPEAPIGSLKPVFTLSDSASAFVAGKQQVSNSDRNNFTSPLYYDVIAKDGVKTKKWKVTLPVVVSVDESELEDKHLLIYPNPSEGILRLQFRNISKSPLRIEIYNTLGVKVFSDMVTETGSFTVEEDISVLSAGVYFLRYSDTEKPVRIVLRKH